MKRTLLAMTLSLSFLLPVTAATPYITWLSSDIAPAGSTKMENYEMPVFSDGLMAASQTSTEGISYGFIDSTGKFAISPSYSHAKPFSQGLAPAKDKVLLSEVNSRLGIYSYDVPDYEGNSVDPTQTWVERYGFIDKTGRFVIPPTFEDAYGFSNGLAAVEITSGEWGYVDTSGTILLRGYTWAHDFDQDGYAIVEKGDTQGVINKQGHYVIPSQFNAIGGGDELYPVRINRLYGLMNTQGELVQTYQYENMSYFKDELALAELNSKWGYVDKLGNLVISVATDVGFHFQDGLAWQQHQGTCYYIDTSGRTRLVMSGLSEVTSFSSGYARGKSGHFYGFFDKTGQIILPFEYRDAVPLSEGIGLVYNGSQWGLFYPQHRSSDWAEPYISQLDNLSLIPSYFQGVDLSSPIDRTQFASLVVTLFDALLPETSSLYYEESTFALPSLWSNTFYDSRDPFVRRAYGLNLTSGLSSEIFGALDSLTREQAATMLLTLLQTITGETLVRQEAPYFEDHYEISPWAEDSVYILAQLGILTGVGNNYFVPHEAISGESAIVMALALCNHLNYRG